MPAVRTVDVQLGERSYPIYIGEDLLQQAGTYLDNHHISKQSPVLIVTDEHVADPYLNIVEQSLTASGFTVVTAIVGAGEQSKSMSVFEEVMTKAIQGGLDRKSTVIALGGGVVGDLAGFVAGSYMRGIRFVQMPTSVLAHDSSVGGKVAINHRLAKNMIGVFHQPEFVLYDLTTLQTLPKREVYAGLAEMVKHGLIWDKEFAYWCLEHAEELKAVDMTAIGYGLEKGCSIKAIVVSRDERENDLRAILNLGHTIGHAIEAVAGYGEIIHGEAISIGMVGSALIGEQLGGEPGLVDTTRHMLAALGLPTVLPQRLDVDQIMEAMMHDKKFQEGSITFVVPKSIGVVEINHNVDYDLVRRVVEQLKEEV